MLGEIGLQPQHLVARDLYMRNDIPLAGCAHQAGTCRFGDDPAASVLDRNCKAHELDNLYVVDTSFFVSIGAVNPSLTAIANALQGGRPPSSAPRLNDARRAAGRQQAHDRPALSLRRRAGPGAGHVSGRERDLTSPSGFNLSSRSVRRDVHSASRAGDCRLGPRAVARASAWHARRAAAGAWRRRSLHGAARRESAADRIGRGFRRCFASPPARSALALARR